ncbi:mannose-1-phosphate guanyltransferase alpha-A [Bacillus rossius redtenbacheri]|uniref:mannose-1-phosphate guanyltransferase alpha-A n=1 Tax=Bacillus rossius redtenbacheri TaxID=93214 RepID=UPI002FDE6E7C
MLKAVILIGGPLKGTRFRPLSLDIPKPLFPVAGLPMIQHHIEACVAVPNLREILILGYYPASELTQFVAEMVQEYKINIRYLQEFMALGTAGGIYHFRDQIRLGSPEEFFILNGDVCADFPLVEMLEFHKQKGNKPLMTMLTTEATRQQSVHFGCIVQDKDSHEVTHYVEKPSTFVSTLINCGVYLCSPELFHTIASAFNARQQEFYTEGAGDGKEAIQLERDVLMPLAGTGRLFALQTARWWSQVKTAGAAIYANRHYLELYRSRRGERLARRGPGSCQVLGDVHIHPSASVHHTATLGPNVSIGSSASIGPGVRVRESIVLSGASIADHSLVLHSIVGRLSRVGRWARVEGTPCDPNPNKPFAKMDNRALFNRDGRLNPSITILGCSVTVPAEVILLNSIVLPYKELTRSFKNEIIL